MPLLLPPRLPPLRADGYPAVGDTFEDPLGLITEAFEFFLSEDAGRPRIQIDASMDVFDRMSIVVAETGFADDSTAGQRAHFVLEQGNSLWTLVYYHTQVLCARGVNTVTWQNGGII